MALESPPALNQRDALPPVEGGAPGPNALDLHLDQKIVTPASARTNVTDGSGTVNFPPIYGAHHPGDSAAASQPAPAQPATHDYTVKNGDSLWRIAKNSLIHGDHHKHVSGEQIWLRIRDIVEANCKAHPDIKSNPFFITKGEHLIVPGADDTQTTAPHGRRTGKLAASGGLGPAAHDSTLASNGGNQAPHDGQLAPQASHLARHDSKLAPNSNKLTPRADATPVADGGHLANALKGEATRQARQIDTVGSCSQGPRQTLEHFGIKIRPMSAVSQGQVLENSGLFDRVPAGEVQPGDYGYRHWSTSTIKRRGLGDLGDSFIVTNCNRNGLQAANDHMFTVPPGGGYYAPGITFLRPNAKFYAAYEHFKATGEKTRLQ